MKAFFQKLFSCQSEQVAEVKNEPVPVVDEINLTEEGLNIFEELKKGCEAFASSYQQLVEFTGPNFPPFNLYLTEENLPDFLNKDEYLPDGDKVCRLSFNFEKIKPGGKGNRLTLTITQKTSPILSKATIEQIKNQTTDGEIYGELLLQYKKAGESLLNKSYYCSRFIREENDLVIEEISKIFAESTKGLEVKHREFIREDRYIESVIEIILPLKGNCLAKIKQTQTQMETLYLFEIIHQSENLVIFQHSS